MRQDMFNKKRRLLISLALQSCVVPSLFGCGGGSSGSSSGNGGSVTSNANPIAKIVGEATVNVYSTAKLDGSTSSDPEGKTLSFTWSWIKRPTASRAKFSDSKAASPSFYVDEPGVYQVSLVVNDGVNDSSPSILSIQANLNNASQKTVVLRFVNTDKTWGQETNPGWPNASPVKESDNYSLYDIEIARNALLVPEKLNAYKFKDYSFEILNSPNFPTYRDQSRVYQGAFDGSSAGLREHLVALSKKIASIERADRVIVFYSGHGAPSVFFEGALNFSDAQIFLSSVRSSFNNPTIVLDFSTNCSVGYLDFAWQVKDHADYLLASDLNVGGFDIDQFDLWFKNNHDVNLNVMFDPKKSLSQCFDTIINARNQTWIAGKNAIISNKVAQSLSAYNLANLVPLLSQIKASSSFNPMTDLAKNDNNLATWITNNTNTAIKEKFTQFQTHYISNRPLFTWPTNPLGFGIENPTIAQSILSTLP